MQFDPLDIGLFAIVLIVLVGPFMSKKIEHNLEVFLFIMGVLAVTISTFYSKEALSALGYTEHQMELIGWNMEIVMEALKEPIIKGIVPMVLVAGVLFHYGRSRAQMAMNSIIKKVPAKIVVFLLVFILGLSSSLITAIIASLLLVELMNCMPFDRKTKINLVIIACFSIGLGRSSDSGGRAAFYYRHYQAAGRALQCNILVPLQPACHIHHTRLSGLWSSCHVLHRQSQSSGVQGE